MLSGTVGRFLRWVANYRRWLLGLLLVLILIQIPNVTYSSGSPQEISEEHFYSVEGDSGQDYEGFIHVRLITDRTNYLLGETEELQVRVSNSGPLEVRGNLSVYIEPELGLVAQRNISLDSNERQTFTFQHRATESMFSGDPPYEVTFRAEFGDANPSISGNYVNPPLERTSVKTISLLLLLSLFVFATPAAVNLLDKRRFRKKNIELADEIVSGYNDLSQEDEISTTPDWVKERDDDQARNLLLTFQEIVEISQEVQQYIEDNRLDKNIDNWIHFQDSKQAFVQGDESRSSDIIEDLDKRREVLIGLTNSSALAFNIPGSIRNKAPNHETIHCRRILENVSSDSTIWHWDASSKDISALMIEADEIESLLSGGNNTGVQFKGATYHPELIIDYLSSSYEAGDILAVRLARSSLTDFINLYSDIEKLDREISKRDYPKVFDRIERGLETENIELIKSGKRRFEGLNKIEEIEQYAEALDLETTTIDETELLEKISIAKDNENWGEIERLLTELEELSGGIWEGQHLFEYSWDEFEHLVAKLWNDMGYTTTVTQATGDSGIDVIAESGMDRVLIQVKQNSPGNNVGRPDIQKTVGALTGRNANRVVIVTTSAFTNTAVEEAQRSSANIDLISGKELLQLLNESRIPPPE